MRVFIILIIGVIAILALIMFRLPQNKKTSIQSMVMPGPLTKLHAEYESQCQKCHSAFEKETQNDLCLKCHEDVASDLKASQGFHGRFETVKEKQCKDCHTDHKGRKFDIVRLDRETFNHALTDFPLTGAHNRLSVTCDSCHLPGKRFNEALHGCFDCHAKDDHHQGRLGTDCSSCHKETSWKETYFDHSKTDFQLKGKHKEVTCQACHSNEIYKDTPTQCIGCHMIDDIHTSLPQEHCERCHSTEGWKTVSFDHNKETKFLLADRHAQLKCDDCHSSNKFKEKLGLECIDCHKTDDVHKGNNGTSCKVCHTTGGWKKVNFEHDRDTHFPLLGRHHDVKCEDCHKGSLQDKKLDTACYSCHKADDVHHGQEGNQCDKCHNVQGWKDKVKFDHDFTHFPLIGVHAVTACGDCHLSQAFQDADTSCFSCHEKDDYHKKTMGTDCAKCHNPNGWKLWEFDHDTQTHYKLEGAHAGLRCESCHTKPMRKEVKQSMECISCHEKNDVHKGQFGEHCDRCHTTESFKKYFIRE